MQSCGPVKHLDARRNRDQKAENRKHHPGVDRLRANEHMMAPDDKTQDCNRHAGGSDPDVAKDLFARKTGDQFADHTHPRQYHNINRRVRIKPEEMLEKDWITTQLWIKNPDTPEALDRHQSQRDS